MPLPILHTPRLILRPWELGDIDALHSLWTAPDVRRYLWDDVVISRERAAETVRDAIALAEREDLGQWLVLDRGSGVLAGFCGLIRRDGEDAPELMYGLAREWWGRGLATEAARAVLAFGFDDPRCTRITAATDPPNEASQRVMERLGMRFTHRGTLHGLDTLFYEITSNTARR